MDRTYSQIDMDERRKIVRWRTAGVHADIIAEKRPQRVQQSLRLGSRMPKIQLSARAVAMARSE